MTRVRACTWLIPFSAPLPQLPKPPLHALKFLYLSLPSPTTCTLFLRKMWGSRGHSYSPPAQSMLMLWAQCHTLTHKFRTQVHSIPGCSLKSLSHHPASFILLCSVPREHSTPSSRLLYGGSWPQYFEFHLVEDKHKAGPLAWSQSSPKAATFPSVSAIKGWKPEGRSSLWEHVQGTGIRHDSGACLFAVPLQTDPQVSSMFFLPPTES